MKRRIYILRGNYLVVIFVLCVMMLSACANGAVETPTITPQPHEIVNSVGTTQAPIFGESPAAQITDSVAYYFAQNDSAQMYFGFAYNNSGDCPINVTAVKVTFSLNGIEYSDIFENSAGGACAVYPNETSYIALWAKNTYCESDKCDIKVIKGELVFDIVESARGVLNVSNLYLVKNYAEFATISGNVEASDGYGLGMVFCAYYDANNKLLGVWYFSVHDNASFFSSQMTGLPVDGIAEDTKTIKSFAFVVE